MYLLIPAWLLAVNVLAFLLYGIDKYKAKADRRRIPERVLLGVAALGGALGAWLGMQAFHHKTRKPRFRYGVPALFFGWLVLLALIWPYIPMPLLL